MKRKRTSAASTVTNLGEPQARTRAIKRGSDERTYSYEILGFVPLELQLERLHDVMRYEEHHKLTR